MIEAGLRMLVHLKSDLRDCTVDAMIDTTIGVAGGDPDILRRVQENHDNPALEPLRESIKNKKAADDELRAAAEKRLADEDHAEQTFPSKKMKFSSDGGVAGGGFLMQMQMQMGQFAPETNAKDMIAWARTCNKSGELHLQMMREEGKNQKEKDKAAFSIELMKADKKKEGLKERAKIEAGPRKAEAEAKKAKFEAEGKKAEAEAKKAEADAKKAEEETKKAQAEAEAIVKKAQAEADAKKAAAAAELECVKMKGETDLKLKQLDMEIERERMQIERDKLAQKSAKASSTKRAQQTEARKQGEKAATPRKWPGGNKKDWGYVWAHMNQVGDVRDARDMDVKMKNEFFCIYNASPPLGYNGYYLYPPVVLGEIYDLVANVE
jgi:hypothetical protein